MRRTAGILAAVAVTLTVIRLPQIARMLLDGGTGGRSMAAGVLAVTMLLTGTALSLRKGRNDAAATGRTTTSLAASAAAAVLFAMIFVAVFAPVFAPYDPTLQLNLQTLQNTPPSLAHPLGTDFYSRDVLSRMIYGARISLSIASLAVVLSVVLGTGVGLVAGFLGGAIDGFLMRVIDAALAIPRIFLLLLVIALWEGTGPLTLAILLGSTSWFGTSRLVRAETMALRHGGFVEAARALGFRSPRILTRHILPNVIAPVIVSATLGIGQMILLEAGVSFLGFGVAEPVPSWGNLIRDGQTSLLSAPWIAAVPGIAIIVTVLSFSVLGDQLRNMLDSRT